MEVKSGSMVNWILPVFHHLDVTAIYLILVLNKQEHIWSLLAKMTPCLFLQKSKCSLYFLILILFLLFNHLACLFLLTSLNYAHLSKIAVPKNKPWLHECPKLRWRKLDPDANFLMLTVSVLWLFMQLSFDQRFCCWKICDP